MVRRQGLDRARREPPSTRLAEASARVRGDLTLSALDAFMVVVAYTTLLLLRFDASVPTRYWERFWLFLPAAVIVHLAANWCWGAYGRMWQHASVDEARRLLLAGVTSGVVLLAAFGWWPEPRVPLSVIVVGPLVATLLMGAPRFQSRLVAFERLGDRSSGLRVVVAGAGSTGAAVVREMQRDRRLGLTPVAIVDDDASIRGRVLSGVRVVAAIDDLASVVLEREAHQLLLAIPSAGPELTRRIAAGADEAGVPVKVLPTIADLVHGRGSVRAARALRIEDLLGRQQVEVDIESVGPLLIGRRVLVTGGGGSIGAEIARQVAGFEPARLALLDHDETHLHDVTQSLRGRCEQVLADVRERRAIAGAFEDVRPEVVFHAAAHKHVPILESNATEAFTTNVLGTLNVVEEAAACGTERLVVISTDKAARPVGVMGASKWLAEQVVLARTPPGRRYCSVRFGNVVGSRGSVVPTFQQQIAAGGPVTVTDPGMTRFFMSPQEAISLVLQAAALATDSEVFMLEMGEPVNILRLAERMIRLSGYSESEVPIQVTEPRPGERLNEELRAPGEPVEPTSHPSVIILLPGRLPLDELDGTLRRLTKLADARDEGRMREQLLAAATPATMPEEDAPGNRRRFHPSVA